MKGLLAARKLNSKTIQERRSYEAVKKYPAIDGLFKLKGICYGFQHAVQKRHPTNYVEARRYSDMLAVLSTVIPAIFMSWGE